MEAHGTSLAHQPRLQILFHPAGQHLSQQKNTAEYSQDKLWVSVHLPKYRLISGRCPSVACFLPLIDYVTPCRSLLLSGTLSSHLLKGSLEVDQPNSSCGPNTLRAPLSAPCPVCALLLAPLCPQVFLFLPFIIKMYTSHSWAWLPFVSFLTATQM